MNNESKLKFPAGDRKPFAVPDNYFVDFATQFIEQECKIRPQRKHVTLRRWLTAAAACAGLVLATHLTLQTQDSTFYDEEESYEVYLSSQYTDDIYYDYFLAEAN